MRPTSSARNLPIENGLHTSESRASDEPDAFWRWPNDAARLRV